MPLSKARAGLTKGPLKLSSSEYWSSDEIDEFAPLEPMNDHQLTGPIPSSAVSPPPISPSSSPRPPEHTASGWTMSKDTPGSFIIRLRYKKGQVNDVRRILGLKPHPDRRFLELEKECIRSTSKEPDFEDEELMSDGQSAGDIGTINLHNNTETTNLEVSPDHTWSDFNASDSPQLNSGSSLSSTHHYSLPYGPLLPGPKATRESNNDSPSGKITDIGAESTEGL